MQPKWTAFQRIAGPTAISLPCQYYKVGKTYLQGYIDERLYRRNTRKASQTERFSDMFARSIGLIVRWSEIKLCQAA